MNASLLTTLTCNLGCDCCCAANTQAAMTADAARGRL